MNDILTNIKTALAQFANAADFVTATKKFLNVLGYHSERTLPPFVNVAEFLQTFPNMPKHNTDGEKRFVAAVKSVQIVFQLTDTEVKEQSSLIDSATFNQGDTKSFLFVAVQLKNGGHSRGKYAEWTREINKRFGMPVVVLFVCADANHNSQKRLTLAFVGRRKNMTNESRDVLQKVSLLREIHCTKPHRGHLDILAALSFDNRLDYIAKQKFDRNFDGLLKAWLHELDADALNKRFYDDLKSWFDRAKETIVFPKNIKSQREDWVIRLITRLLFIWFIKEKNLIDDKLFAETNITLLLKNYRTDGNSYYRVVLQNLFFATLNTPMNERRFSRTNNADHRNPYVYRYHDEIADNRKDKLLECFDKTPFINGGLFDSLDDFSGIRDGGERVDYFSDVHGKNLSVPNALFFDSSRGLISLFERYKFTVEENTPIEQEVALDPELLGKVFENLLAAYNPETRENARKQTGSYYTPREIVDYMARESLAERLATTTAANTDKNAAQWRQQIGDLLDYAKPDIDMTAAEKKSLVAAIADIKIFDPAAGSGAFLMGVLHQLSLALSRLDNNNHEWKKLQKSRAQKEAAAAFDKPDKIARGDRLEEINETFTRYSTDFGRKLFLIQNSIFGADIQPVACQIAKLRFFISLAIEQTPNLSADNLGIKPLPNLETRFVIADTLTKIGAEKSGKLASKNTTATERQLSENRERHFNATVRQQKIDCRKEDKRLRKDLAAYLQTDGFGNDDAQKIADWDPYDQNKSADWFSAEYMFGIRDGFDIVIGNPPYVQLQADGGRLGKKFENQGFVCFAKTSDIYALFYEKGINLLKQGGYLCYITSNKWMRAGYGEKLRGFFATQNPVKLLDFGGVKIFESVTVDTNIIIIQNDVNAKNTAAVQINKDYKKGDDITAYFNQQSVVLSDLNTDAWIISDKNQIALKAKIEIAGVPLKEWNININRGVMTGLNDAFIIDQATRNRLIAEDAKSKKIIKPVLRGRDIKRHQIQWANLYIILTEKDTDIEKYPAIKNHLMKYKKRLINRAAPEPKYWFALQLATVYYDNSDKEKIIYPETTQSANFYYDTDYYCVEKTGFILLGNELKYLTGCLSSTLITYFYRNFLPGTKLSSQGWQYNKHAVIKIPVPYITPDNLSIVEKIKSAVDKIHVAKKRTPPSPTSDLEKDIDKLVYELYGLTEEEIKIVEGA